MPFVRLGPASSSAHRRARAAAGVWAGVRPAAGEGIWAMGQAGGGQGGSGDQSGRTGGRGGDQGGVLQESSGAAATSAARGRSGSQWTWAWAGAGLRWRRGERHSSSGLWWRLRGTGRDGRGGGGSQALCRANPKSPAPVEGSARGRSCVSGSGRPCALSLLGEWAAVGCAREMGPNGLIGRFRHLPTNKNTSPPRTPDRQPGQGRPFILLGSFPSLRSSIIQTQPRYRRAAAMTTSSLQPTTSSGAAMVSKQTWAGEGEAQEPDDWSRAFGRVLIDTEPWNSRPPLFPWMRGV